MLFSVDGNSLIMYRKYQPKYSKPLYCNMYHCSVCQRYSYMKRFCFNWNIANTEPSYTVTYFSVLICWSSRTFLFCIFLFAGAFASVFSLRGTSIRAFLLVRAFSYDQRVKTNFFLELDKNAPSSIGAHLYQTYDANTNVLFLFSILINSFSSICSWALLAAVWKSRTCISAAVMFLWSLLLYSMLVLYHDSAWWTLLKLFWIPFHSMVNPYSVWSSILWQL